MSNLSIIVTFLSPSCRLVFTALWLAVFAVSCPLQPVAAAGKLHVLAVKTSDNPFYSPTLLAFTHDLEAGGDSLGKNMDVTIVSLTGDDARDSQMLHTQLQRNTQLILTLGTNATRLIANQHPSAPVLFSMILDPVSLGVAQSLDVPGGDFTGTTLLVSPGKQLDALLQIAPQVKRVGVIYTDRDPTSLAFLAEARRDAERLSVVVVDQPVASGVIGKDELQQLAGKVDAFWLIPDPASTGAQALSETLAVAQERHLPILGTSSGTVHAGALLALSANLSDLGSVCAEMAAPLLQGSGSPAKMRIRGPRRTVLSINLVAAKSLGLTVPDSVLHLADEVIDADVTK